MIAEGFPMVEMRPTVLNFSEPMKELEALVLEGRIHHTGDKVLEWMMSNVVCHLDAKDNIYPRKTLPENNLTRVYDKIPVRALGQEVAGNRVIYANFQNKHTPPQSLNYNVSVSPKSDSTGSSLDICPKSLNLSIFDMKSD